MVWRRLVLRLIKVHRLIALLTEALATAKSLQNAHSPVHRLPDELLVTIFKRVPLQELYTDWFDSPSVSTKDLIPLTSVCRRWRNVTLSTHSLWSSICDMPVAQNTLFLERSGASLLTCHMFLAGHTVRFCMDILEQHHSRIRKLQAIPCNDVRSPVFLALSQLPMPELEQAAIGHYNITSPVHFSDNARFLLFNGYAPRLRKLALFRVRGFPDNQFEKLTHLSFTPEWYSTVKLPDLVAFLSQCPRLQHLILASLHFNPATRLVEQTVYLPHLRTLVIRSTRSLIEVDLIISSIVTPPASAVLISGAYIEEGLSNLRSIHPPNTSSHPFTRAHFDLHNNRLFMIVASKSSAISVDAIPNPTQESVAKIHDTIHWFQAETITELWLRVESNPRSAPLLGLAHAFPSVTALVLRVDKYGLDDTYDTLLREDAWGMLHAPVLYIGPCVTYVRLCLWYGTIPPSVVGGLARKAMVGQRLEKLILEIPHERVPAFDVVELEEYAVEVEIRRTSGCEWMEVPEAYAKRPHYRWPVWPERKRWAPIPDAPWAA